MEAAGIEPASESESFETTTCVVDLLWCRLVHTGSDRQDPDRTSPEGFAGGAGTGTADYPAVMSPGPAAQAPPVPTGYLIAQAANAYELSLAFEEFPRISEVSGTSARALEFSTPVEAKSPPRSPDHPFTAANVPGIRFLSIRGSLTPSPGSRCRGAPP